MAPPCSHLRSSWLADMGFGRKDNERLVLTGCCYSKYLNYSSCQLKGRNIRPLSRFSDSPLTAITEPNQSPANRLPRAKGRISLLPDWRQECDSTFSALRASSIAANLAR